MGTKISWRCFFCGELFTDRKEAANHFGVDESCVADEVACKLMSYQKKVVEYIRELESEVRRLTQDQHNESHPLMLAIYDIEDKLKREVQQAEQRGYTKGVQDMITQGLCPEPQKHIV